jgi:hypothetical protein
MAEAKSTEGQEDRRTEGQKARSQVARGPCCYRGQKARLQGGRGCQETTFSGGQGFTVGGQRLPEQGYLGGQRESKEPSVGCEGAGMLVFKEIRL